ncbi:MAG TPA: fatty acid desaturase [Ignavibacteria bacterium]|nr:fatty acid desaturase [Bacteroidota bacterium]HRE09702.1 fatty acid desaturase [Ignavibacteria bacterium]HRF65570.1 fatty acid desaturase [Ignavibacteria bacterium]HRJ02934.1 fatty acid desaturase [Ignavibacteria bacterium]HRJ85261.1 fatty acid desaturase [Ignavibacteria bacterium]
MLRYKADIKTLIYMFITTSLFILQWTVIGFNPIVFIIYCFFSIAVAVITHNHNHVRIWKSNFLNTLQDWWLTVFYGFPVFAWIPTHNKNHHKMNNRVGDYTITYRFSEKNNFLTLITYPTISGFYQQKAIRDYLKDMYRNKKSRFYLAIAQYAVLVIWIGAFLLLDWKKALLYVIIPQQVSLFSVLIFNYVQHVHANEESEWNHSRNFTGFLNFLLFNNGLHTVHHETAGLHWSQVPEEHKKVEHLIDDSLKERSFWWYIFRNYVMGFFNKKYKTDSMRLQRIEQEQRELRKLQQQESNAVTA